MGEAKAKTIDCNIAQPYFDWIKKGSKEYEGRVPVKDSKWSEVKVGDILCASPDKSRAETISLFVKEVKKYPDFAAAYEELIPSFDHTKFGGELSASDKAKKTYELCFNADDIKTYGAVVFRIEVVK